MMSVQTRPEPQCFFGWRQAPLLALLAALPTGSAPRAHHQLADDDAVDNPLDLAKKHGHLIVLLNKFVWVILLLRFAIFIHDPKNA